MYLIVSSARKFDANKHGKSWRFRENLPDTPITVLEHFGDWILNTFSGRKIA
jgi:hypothetical protein